MILSYIEYLEMGGCLDEAAFLSAQRKAEYFLNAQCGGRTGERIRKLESIPQAVKDCVFELVEFSELIAEKQIASESQSQGGASESYSYVTKTESELEAQRIRIVEEILTGGGLGYFLYRGACL